METTNKNKTDYKVIVWKTLKYGVYITILYFAFEGFMAWP